MNKSLASAILKTVSPYWYDKGTPIIHEYADVLEKQGLITIAGDGYYKMTKKGHLFLDGDPLIPIASFTEDPSDILENKFSF